MELAAVHLATLQEIYKRLSNDTLERTFKVDLPFVNNVISEYQSQYCCEQSTQDQYKKSIIDSDVLLGFQSTLEKIQNHICPQDARFEVREVEGRGKSLFAKEDIPADTLVGVYHGYILSGFRAQKGECKYLVPISGRDLYFVDPTLASSIPLPELSHCVAFRINEPPPGPGNVPNCRWVRKKFQPPEVWTRGSVGKGEELFLYYGDCFTRDYPIPEGLIFDCWDELEEELKSLLLFFCLSFPSYSFLSDSRERYSVHFGWDEKK